ncbi:MAG: YggS family pyridoxal phosphate-dependent enzyme [Myxococcales bacterium]
MSSASLDQARMPSVEELAEGKRRYAAVQTRIAQAAERAGRSPEDITLVGVAKKQPPQRILAAIAAGLRVLGQSYIQEAREIRPLIEAALASDEAMSEIRLRWHMVGQLQRNKAGLAARLFETIETLDRPKLVQTLSRKAGEETRTLDVLIQVSLCGEPQKGGCEPEALVDLAEQILIADGLRLRGLMTIPAAPSQDEGREEHAIARQAFRELRELRATLARLDPDLHDTDLSMGMSGDFEVAIEEGATLVRVGTALFGERIVPTKSS